MKLEIPENFYGIADSDSDILLPALISCMGIAITTNENTTIAVHLADIDGYPSKKIGPCKSPLPKAYQANGSDVGSIFEFLLSRLNESSISIKNITIFGNYRLRHDVFPECSDEHGLIDSQLIIKHVAKKVEVSLASIRCLPCRYVDVHIDQQGKASIIQSEEVKLDLISVANYTFFSTTPRGASLTPSPPPKKRGSRDDFHL